MRESGSTQPSNRFGRISAADVTVAFIFETGEIAVRQFHSLRYCKTPPRATFQTIDFSGWPLITHRWLPNELAYAICEAIDARQGVIPIDDDHPLDMRKLCRSMDASPLGIPLHPGAKQYYREKGYLFAEPAQLWGQPVTDMGSNLELDSSQLHA